MTVLRRIWAVVDILSNTVRCQLLQVLGDNQTFPLIASEECCLPIPSPDDKFKRKATPDPGKGQQSDGLPAVPEVASCFCSVHKPSPAAPPWPMLTGLPPCHWHPCQQPVTHHSVYFAIAVIEVPSLHRFILEQVRLVSTYSEADMLAAISMQSPRKLATNAADRPGTITGGLALAECCTIK